MTKLFSLMIISLLAISVFAVFAEAIYSGNSKTYISSKEMRENMMEKTQQNLDYAKNKFLDTSNPKTKVYQTLHSVNVIPGESAKMRMNRETITTAAYLASEVAKSNAKRIFEDKKAASTQQYLSHDEMSKKAAQNSVNSKAAAMKQYHKKFTTAVTRGY